MFAKVAGGHDRCRNLDPLCITRSASDDISEEVCVAAMQMEGVLAVEIHRLIAKAAASPRTFLPSMAVVRTILAIPCIGLSPMGKRKAMVPSIGDKKAR